MQHIVPIKRERERGMVWAVFTQRIHYILFVYYT